MKTYFSAYLGLKGNDAGQRKSVVVVAGSLKTLAYEGGRGWD